MDNYIGTKSVIAEPAYRCNGQIYPKTGAHPRSMSLEDGYKVIYPDGYISWSPKDVFEKAYMKIGANNTITQENVDKFIACYKDYKLDDKTIVVKATLVNGFEIVESSSCVDPKNFNQEVGIEICLQRIKDKVWMLLGFLLQTANGGVK